MRARRLTHYILRPWIASSIAHRLSTPQTWRPPRRLQGFDTGAFHSRVAFLATRKQYGERPLDFNQHDEEEPQLAQQVPSVSDSLQRRLKYPRRKKGYEGNNVTPKHDKDKTTPEGGNEQAIDHRPFKGKQKWRAMETSELEVHLQRVAHHFPSVRRVHNLLRVLTVHRSVKPTVSHYEAMILANCDAELGSVKAVKAVLQEMEREHIAMGTSIYEAVLKVLAVHPDYVFRASILDSMVKQWMSLTPSMEHFVTAGYIREGQLELALQSVEKMQQEKIPIGQWLYGSMIYSLCEVEDFEAVLRLLYFAEDERVDIPTYTLHHVLDRASECLNLDLTKRIWRAMVEPTYINPSTGICHNVLLTAARAGDTALADSVSKVLSHRQSKPSDLEYDLLEETYVKAGDEGGAEKIRLRREQILDSPIRYRLAHDRHRGSRTGSLKPDETVHDP